VGKQVVIPTGFLPEGEYDLEAWSDSKKSDTLPAEIQKKFSKIKAGEPQKLSLARNGGYVAVIRKK